MKSWYIDSIEPRGGLAFTTRRDAEKSDRPLEEGATVFMTAPAFEAELVGSRAIALAAERAGFQVGVILRGEELPFPTLEAVRDFVRRVYVFNGPDRTPGLGGTAEEPPVDKGSPGGSMVLPGENEPRGGGKDAAWLFAEGLEKFREASRQQVPGTSQAVSAWGREPPGRSKKRDVRGTVEFSGRALAKSLAAGAWWCIVDLFARIPYAAGDPRWEPWTSEARALARCLDRFDLWVVIAHAFAPSHLERELPANLKVAWSDGQQGEPRAMKVLLWARHQMMYGDRASFADFEGWWHNPFSYPSMWQPDSPREPSQSPYDDLGALRCPLAMKILRPQPELAHPTMRTLLMRILSAPLELLRADGAERHDAVDLLLFSAAQVVAPALSDQFTSAQPGMLSQRPAPFSERAFAGLAEILWQWIEANLPRHAHAPEVEAIIGAGLRKVTQDVPPTIEPAKAQEHDGGLSQGMNLLQEKRDQDKGEAAEVGA